MKRTAIGALALVAIVALAGPGVVGAADDPVVRATASGDTVTIAIETVPDAGLAGFGMTVETTSDVTIESIGAGNNFPLSDSSVSEDGESATVKGSDAGQKFSGGETDVTLATVYLSETVDQPPITISFETLQDNEGEMYDATIRIADDGSSGGGGAEETTTEVTTTEETETTTTTTEETTTEETETTADDETETTADDETETTADESETTTDGETETTADESETTTDETTTDDETETTTESVETTQSTTADEETTTDGGGAPATTGSGPGFGVTLALAALAAIGLVARVRPY